SGHFYFGETGHFYFGLTEGVTNAFEALRDPEQHAKILIDPKRSGSDIQLMSH
uniref:hypothetical protein n=1 Tax=Acinetobacter baumannii TaxID=470 RepID=UPI001D173E75